MALQFVCLYIVYKASVTTTCFLTSITLFHRLLKSRLEKEVFESKLNDLQDSLVTRKKQMPASESSVEVIHKSVTRQNTDYACCVGENQGIITSVLHSIHVFIRQNSLVFLWKA